MTVAAILLAVGAEAVQSRGMKSDPIRPTRERALGMALIAILAAIAIAGLAFFIYMH